MKVMTVRENNVGSSVGMTTRRREDLERPGTEVPGSLHGVIVNPPDGVAQEEGMIGCTGKGHGEQDRIETCKPLFVHAREEIRKPFGHQSVRIIEELISGHQGDAGINQGRHISQPEDLCALDIKILRQKHD